LDNLLFLNALLWVACACLSGMAIAGSKGACLMLCLRLLSTSLTWNANDRFDHRAGASTRCGRPLGKGANDQGLGRYRGGLSLKSHAAGDALWQSGQADRRPLPGNEIIHASMDLKPKLPMRMKTMMPIISRRKS
jgi:hypothetical protein